MIYSAVWPRDRDQVQGRLRGVFLKYSFFQFFSSDFAKFFSILIFVKGSRGCRGCRLSWEAQLACKPCMLVVLPKATLLNRVVVW